MLTHNTDLDGSSVIVFAFYDFFSHILLTDELDIKLCDVSQINLLYVDDTKVLSRNSSGVF